MLCKCYWIVLYTVAFSLGSRFFRTRCRTNRLFLEAFIVQTCTTTDVQCWFTRWITVRLPTVSIPHCSNI